MVPERLAEADVGIAGGKRIHFVLFRRGEVVRRISKEKAVDELTAEIDKLLSERADRFRSV